MGNGTVPTSRNQRVQNGYVLNKAGVYVNPSTEEKQDDIISNQTDGSQLTGLVNTSQVNVNPATEDKQDDIITAINVKKHFSVGNKRTTILTGGASFTGAWEDVSNYVQAIIDLNVDQDAAADGLRFEFSDDGATVRHAHSFSPVANDPDGHHYATTLDSQYFRVKYTNGAVTQGSFYLSATYFENASEEGHVHPVNYVIDDDHQAAIVRAILLAVNPAGVYGNINRTTGGNLKISLEEWDASIDPIRSDMEGGGYISVGTTAVGCTFTGTPTHSIIISADPLNTGILYVGESNVTSAGANAIAFLQAGESITIDYDDSTNVVYVVSDTAAQQFMKGALL
jgi:hypothetical protein